MELIADKKNYADKLEIKVDKIESGDVVSNSTIGNITDVGSVTTEDDASLEVIAVKLEGVERADKIESNASTQVGQLLDKLEPDVVGSNRVDQLPDENMADDTTAETVTTASRVKEADQFFTPEVDGDTSVEMGLQVDQLDDDKSDEYMATAETATPANNTSRANQPAQLFTPGVAGDTSVEMGQDDVSDTKFDTRYFYIF